MSVTGIIQARSGSTRLPGKVLAPIGDRPLLGFMLHRLRHAPLDALVVATSDSPADDAVAAVAAAEGLPAIRGPEQDVLARFGVALDAYPADVVVRMTADCPLLDPAIVADAIDVHRASGASYTSNTLIRTYPDGLDVEVIEASALRAVMAEAEAPDEREHVTPFLYRRPERFRLSALRSDELAGDERWTVDTADDLEFVRTVASRLGDRVDLGWQEILALVGRRSVPRPGELALKPAMPADSSFVLELRNDHDAVRFSVTGRRVEAAEHESWYRSRLSDPSSRLWIASVDGERVGQVRVDVAGAVGTVSIAIAPSQRGRGHARASLVALQRALRADLQVMRLEATIDPTNAASLRAFTGAGFDRVADDGGFARLQWIR
jgi:spore coat polysaccharide biosynthesis protein SpsF